MLSNSLKLPNRSITVLLYTECIESSGPPGVVLGKFLQEWEIRKGLYNFITWLLGNNSSDCMNRMMAGTLIFFSKNITRANHVQKAMFTKQNTEDY